jgi:hypothetical protein
MISNGGSTCTTPALIDHGPKPGNHGESPDAAIGAQNSIERIPTEDADTGPPRHCGIGKRAKDRKIRLRQRGFVTLGAVRVEAKR